MMQLMSDKEDGLVFEESSDAAVEELLADLGVNGGEGIVEEVEAAVTVDTPGHAHLELTNERTVK